MLQVLTRNVEGLMAAHDVNWSDMSKQSPGGKPFCTVG